MAPANAKANYKTYEAQARMVRAIVAAHPEVKWNYKDHALNHRFRKVRATVNIIHKAREQGFDVKDLTTDENLLPSTQGAIDNNIAKYFGQSTADGIQFQFRTIKKDAESLRQAANNGGDVANCLNLGTGSGPGLPNTPSKPTPSRQPGSRSAKGSKRKTSFPALNPIKRSASEDEDEDELNFDDMDHTPSKKVKTTGRTPRGTTPSRSAARKAAATIADASAQYHDSESPYEDAPTPTPAPVSIHAAAPPAALPPSTTVAPTSIFGNVERKPQLDMMGNSGLDMMASVGSGYPNLIPSNGAYRAPPPDDSSYMEWGDGEI
ncbi:hypothetical protein F53441_6833 [Fusarium austroafricanum]|uniref:Uncharacterized protein n=1 Tax=Fusarium austroafricanum TaxID=2364996 RepID=A0A8H4NW53_9HYPO|nr:hypothetical protein F53441_6833 [Fusarium austroafricanum]